MANLAKLARRGGYDGGMSAPPPARPTIVMLASGPRWEAAWRRTDATAPIANVPTLVDCRRRLAASPDSIAVLDYSACAAEELAGFLANDRLTARRGLAVVVGDAALETHRWPLMECGADWVITSERQLPEVALLVRRRLACWSPSDLGWRERIWMRLPWGR